MNNESQCEPVIICFKKLQNNLSKNYHKSTNSSHLFNQINQVASSKELGVLVLIKQPLSTFITSPKWPTPIEIVQTNPTKN